MRIMQTRSQFRDNGPGTQSLTISQELRRRGYDVVFAGGHGPLTEFIEEAGFRFLKLDRYVVGQRGALSVLRNVRRLAKFIREESVDVVHAHNAAAAVMAYWGAKVARRDVGVVHSVRGVELRPGYQWRNRIFKWSPAHMLAVCEFTKCKLLSFGVDPSRVAVSYNGVDTERFNPDRVVGAEVRREFGLERRLIVGSVGAIDGAKGQEVLVDAISRLRERHPSICALLVGDGPDRTNVERRVDALGMREHVVFAGMRFDSERFHAAFDIYAQPSTRGEMFPNSILEAMAMRTPWVGSELSGLPEMTADGEAGRTSPPGDVESLARNLSELLLDEDLRHTRGLRAETEIHERFTIGRVVSRIEEAYARSRHGKTDYQQAAA